MVFSLALRGLPFSIFAGVGFVALLGIAVLNSLVWVSTAEHMRALGLYDIETITFETAMIWMRPIMMTTSVAAVGFLPMTISHGDGAEIQRPLATVVIGGHRRSAYINHDDDVNPIAYLSAIGP